MGAKDLLLLSGTLLIYLNLPVFADTREQPNSPQMIFLEEPHKFDHIAQNSAASESSDHLTSVSQLSDVQPSDQAFRALQSLVERYGVISGYPDSTFQGNRSLTPQEFAAGLQAVMQKINELLVIPSREDPLLEDTQVIGEYKDKQVWISNHEPG